MRFRARDGSVDGNILSQSAPGNSGRVDSQRKRPALPVNMVKESLLDHVAGMRPRNRSQSLIPLEGLSLATRLGGVLGVPAVAVDEPHICLSKSAMRSAPDVCRGSDSAGTTFGAAWFGPQWRHSSEGLCPATEAPSRSPK